MIPVQRNGHVNFSGKGDVKEQAAKDERGRQQSYLNIKVTYPHQMGSLLGIIDSFKYRDRKCQGDMYGFLLVPG